jgi:hypothetical protein
MPPTALPVAVNQAHLSNLCHGLDGAGGVSENILQLDSQSAQANVLEVVARCSSTAQENPH